MNEMVKTLQQVIKKHLQQGDFELLGILPIPPHRDLMVRMRTLQEMIEEFEDSDGGDSLGYFIQIRARQFSPSPMLPNSSGDSKALLEPGHTSASEESTDSVYLPNGKLNIPFLLQNGQLLLDSGEYELAKKLYKVVLESGEMTHIAFFDLGRCFELEKKFAEAQTYYEKSIAFHPSLEVFRKLSTLLIQQKKDSLAAEIFERALLLKDLSPHIRFEIHKACGNCWARTGQVLPSEKHFKLALEITPSADEIRSNLGTLYLQNNRMDEAKRNFRDAIASNSKNALALSGLGICYLAENDKKAAHDSFARSLEIDIQNPKSLFQLVKCAYEIKSYATAAKLVEDYIQISPISANVLYSLAGLQYHLGRIEEAKTTTQKILSLQSEHTGAKELLARIERYTGTQRTKI